MNVCRLSWTKSIHHQESLPLPLISRLLDQLGHAKMYTKINLRGEYNLVHIREGDEWKMTFKTCYDHFEYVVMSFDLINALVIF